MTIDRHKLRWNGWGWQDAPDLLGDRAEAVWNWMAELTGVESLPDTPATTLEAAALPPTRLSAAQLDDLRARTAPDRVMTDDYERAFHARGKSYPDLISLRNGDLGIAPDAVVYPVSESEVQALVAYGAENGLAIVPFGGGSSVVGGVNALAGGHGAVVTVDLSLMDKVLDIDETAHVARIEAGAYGPRLEASLQEAGWTLGHFPQSFEFSTLGGWIAHRGAGQQSNRYGKAEKWLVGARLATPAGLWQTEAFPASAAGPQLSALVAGSEGVLGIITEATVKLHPVPEKKDYRGYLFMEWEAAVAGARALAQSDLPVAMVRLSDTRESHFFQTLRTVGVEEEATIRFCAMIVGIEGEQGTVDAAAAAARETLERHGAMHMGEDPGTRWMENRFAMPYLRDPMLDRGLGVDTLETATRWSNIPALHAGVTQALDEAIAAHPGSQGGGRGVAMAHISHCYPDGASLYFTYAFCRNLEDEIGQWQAIKTAATEAIVAHGGTISHHHGVGTDHLPWMDREKDAAGLALLRQLKRQLDPSGILNPGKLIPGE